MEKNLLVLQPTPYHYNHDRPLSPDSRYLNLMTNIRATFPIRYIPDIKQLSCLFLLIDSFILRRYLLGVEPLERLRILLRLRLEFRLCV